MRLEFSAGAVVYLKNDDGLKFALVVERSGHCGFPKGHIEAGEDEKGAALREIFEEIGVKATLEGDFVREIEYSIGERKRKKVTFFLALIDKSSILKRGSDIRRVHLVGFDEALRLLTHENSRRILRDALEYITGNQK